MRNKAYFLQAHLFNIISIHAIIQSRSAFFYFKIFFYIYISYFNVLLH